MNKSSWKTLLQQQYAIRALVDIINKNNHTKNLNGLFKRTEDI